MYLHRKILVVGTGLALVIAASIGAANWYSTGKNPAYSSPSYWQESIKTTKKYKQMELDAIVLRAERINSVGRGLEEIHNYASNMEQFRIPHSNNNFVLEKIRQQMVVYYSKIMYKQKLSDIVLEKYAQAHGFGKNKRAAFEQLTKAESTRQTYAMFGLPYEMPKPKFKISNLEIFVKMIIEETDRVKGVIGQDFDFRDIEIVKSGLREARISEALFYSIPPAIGIMILAFL